jgi:hypothetical protein
MEALHSRRTYDYRIEDEPIVSTRVAMDTQESMSEHAAFEIRTNLRLDEPRDGRALPPCTGQKWLELFADDLVEESLFGFVALVLANCMGSAGIGERGTAPSERNRCAEVTRERDSARSDSVALPRPMRQPSTKGCQCRARWFTHSAGPHEVHDARCG